MTVRGVVRISKIHANDPTDPTLQKKKKKIINTNNENREITEKTKASLRRKRPGRFWLTGLKLIASKSISNPSLYL